MASKYDNIDFTSIIEKYQSGSSLNKLSSIYGINITSLRYHLMKMGVTIRGVKESVQGLNYKEPIELTEEFTEFLTGCLLGDGGLRIMKKGVNPYFNYTDKHKEVIDYIGERFNKAGIRFTIRKYAYTGYYSLQTEVRPEFLDLYKLFYANGPRKTLPEIKLTMTSLLWWFIGDGSSVRTQKARTHHGQISCKYRSESILGQLSEITGTECRYYSYTDKSGRSYGNYHINNKGFKRFLELIGPCPLPCYEYKWVLRD